MSTRRQLKLADADAVAAEVRRLRGGYDRAGQWSLPQTCRHLNIAISFSMKGGPASAPPTAELDPRVTAILASGRIPDGIQAPPQAIPPEGTPDGAIDEFLSTLAGFKLFQGEFTPHRLFGHVPRDQYVRLHLIHCSHHLGYLVPTSKPN